MSFHHTQEAAPCGDRTHDKLSSYYLYLSTAKGFEPSRAEPNGFLVHHLSHSVTLSWNACPPRWTPRSLFRPAWPVGLMDKASASGAGDSRFESWTGHLLPSSAIQLVGVRDDDRDAKVGLPQTIACAAVLFCNLLSRVSRAFSS